MSQENVTSKWPLIRHMNRQQPSWRGCGTIERRGAVRSPTPIWQILASGAGGFGAFDFEKFSGAHIVKEAVDRNGFGDKRMIADAGDVIDHGLLLVADGEPLDVFTGAGARALADILEALRGESRGFEARGKQIAHDVIGEEFHAAIGMMDDEEFASAQQFVTYNEGPNGVVAGSPSSVADDVGVAFGQAGVFGGIKARVHAGENGEAARGRQSEFAPLTEIGAVSLIGFQDFRQYLAHGDFLLLLNHRNPTREGESLEARGGIEPPIMVLQTIALPLGDRATVRVKLSILSNQLAVRKEKCTNAPLLQVSTFSSFVKSSPE